MEPLVPAGAVGQFHHSQAMIWIGSMLISSSGISLAGLLTFLWVMHQNVGYSNNIFLCHGGEECVRKHPSYTRSPSYFAVFLQTPYFYYSKVHVVELRQHFELERPSNCEINRRASRWRIFKRRCSIRRSHTSGTWNGLFVWVTPGVRFSWRHLCATLLLFDTQMKTALS